MKEFKIDNVKTITTKKYQDIIKWMLDNIDNESMSKNLIIFGPAGVGKTQIAQEIVKQIGLPLVYINLSVMEATDFLGIPQVVDGVTKWAPPDLFTDENTPSVVLFDELDKSARELQAPLLEFFQSRSIMGKKTGTKIIIATANMPDEGAFSNDISRPVANRSLIYTLQPNVDGWIEWAAASGVHPLVIGYLSKNPDQILVEREDEDDLTLTKPSPRSWTMAANALSTIPDGEFDMQVMVVEGYVGSEAAHKFSVWLKYYSKIGPLVDKILAGNYSKSDVNNLRLDERFVLGISVMSNAMSNIADKDVDEFNSMKKSDRSMILNKIHNAIDFVYQQKNRLFSMF